MTEELGTGSHRVSQQSTVGMTFPRGPADHPCFALCARIAAPAGSYYGSSMPVARKTKTKSFRLDPALVAEAKRAIGAKDETEAVRIALEELLERTRFRTWIGKVAGKGSFSGYAG